MWTPAAISAARLDKQALIDEIALRLTLNACATTRGCTRRCRRSGRCVRGERERALIAERKRRQEAALAPPERRLSTRSERRARLKGLFAGPPQRRKRRQLPPAPAERELSQSVS